MKKILLLMLTLITLGFTAAPVSAQTIWDGTADISWYDASETSFDISTPEQLAGVAQLVNSGATTFNGITLNLTADLWLNADNDSTNNWTPIGGSATATGEEQSSGNAFRGVFNAHGHSIYNLYCEKSSYFHAGLFGCIQNPCTIDSLVMMNPVVKSQGMMGAITGMTRSGGTIYIRYCLVINGRLQGGSGNNIGFMVGANYPNSSGTQIQNCGATGTITGNYVGGLGGNSQNETFTNCYFAGSISGSPAGGIAAYSGTINNCYSYVTNQPSSGNGTVVTDEEMQSEEMITNLGDAFKMDNGVNNGYPIMSYMAGVDPIAAEICQGESITITAFGYDSYVWSNGSTSESITVSPTSSTTYTVTGTMNGITATHTSTITVFPQAVVTAEVAASADGQTHGTISPESATVACLSSDNVTFTVTPDANYRVCRVTLNGAQIYGDEFGEGQVTLTVNPNGTLGTVKVFLSNEYTISIVELQDTGDTLHIPALVQPYGDNGVVTVTAGSDQTFNFNNTARYALTNAEIDGASQGVIYSYDFIDIHENHSIVVTYVDSCGIAALPFFEDFEGAASSTVPDCYEAFQYSSYPNVQNSASNAHSGSKSIYAYMYGTTYDYILVLPKVIDTITYPLSDLKVSFWGRTSSTSNSFTVGVMSDPTNIGTFTPVTSFVPTSTTYAEYTCYIGNAGYGNEYIAIRFDCGSSYTNSSIDDISVDFAPQCSPVTNLQADNIFGTNATLTWEPNAVGEASEYNIYVLDIVNEIESEYSTTETSYLVSGLSELTPYKIGVYVTCDNGQTSDTAFVNFMTPCNNPVSYSVGEATTTNSYLPTYIYYGNTYSQQIVTADVFESTPNDFASISLKDNTNSPTVRSCDIYLAHVPADTTLSNGWILPDPANDFYFTQVFSGDVQFGSGSWVKIDFDTVFPYNGTDNVLVVFNDHTNSYTSSHTYDVIGNSNTNAMARYAYRDNTPYDVSNPNVSGTLLNVVNTFLFSYCDESDCIRPNTLTASNITEFSADIEWVSAGSESNWEVEYKAASDTEWTSAGTASTTSFNLNGLAGNTLYQVRVRALCSSTDISAWSDVTSFRTECSSISALPFSEDFEDGSAIYNTNQGDYILCWDRYASNPSHYVYVPSNTYAHSGTHFLDFHHTNGCFNIAIMPALDASLNISDLMVSFYACRSGSSGTLEVGVMTDKTDPTTFVAVDTIDLSSYNTYEYGLQQVSFENYSESGSYIAFRVSNAVSCGFYVDDVLVEERPICLYPTNFHTVNVSNEEVTLTWTETGSATSWNILYDVTGFDPETEGSTIMADANPFTITDLQNITTYDFYVQADCGGMNSPWTGPLTITTGIYTMGVTGSDTLTTCGSIIYDNGGPNENYSTYCDYTLVVYPATEGSGLQIGGTGNIYSSTYGGSSLTFYEGVGTGGNQLASYSGNNVNIAVASSGPITIHFTSSYYSASGFELTAICSDCTPPTNVSITDASMTEASISWSGNADQYAVVLSGPTSGYFITSDTTFELTDLVSSSSYSVQIRALCGSDSSLLSPSVSFNTSCGAITITAETPWFEDFEGYTGSGAQPFVCWETPITEVVDNGTSPFVYCGHSPSCHSGANSAELKGTSNMVVLPEFSNDIHDLRLSFWATTTNTSNYGTVEIGVVTNVFDPNSFELLGPAGTPGPRGGSGSGHGNYMGPFDFNGVQATSGRIAIKFTGYSGLSWNLDDFTVELVPGCPSPVKTSVTATNIDGHNATISFTDNDPDHSSWTVYYREHNAAADDPWMSVVTSTTTVDLNSLDPETTYDVYVITNCAVPDEVADATNTIQFTTLVACPAPQNITVSATTDEAVVTWFGTADSYTVTCGDFTATVTETTVTITGLNPASNYTVSITADCGTEGTSSAGTASFMTACDVISVFPYNEGFESGQLGCWTQETITGNNAWTISSSYYNSGTHGVGMSYTNNTSSRLISPIFDLTSVTNPMLSFYRRMHAFSGTIDTIGLYYRTSITDEWMWFAGFNQVTNGFEIDSVALPNPSATYQFAVVGYAMDGWGIYLDDIQVYDGSGSGPVLTDPTVATNAATDIAQTTATLNATITNPDNVTITAKGFEWKTSVGGTYTPVTVTGNNLTYNLTGLTANTGYTYKAFITFNGTTVYGSEMTFTTLPEEVEPCDVPTNLHTTDIQNESIAIAWDANANVNSWNVQYRPAENGQWTQVTVNTNSYTITNLTGKTNYEIQVQANCGDGNLSDWSASITAQTTDVGIVNYLENSITLFPNPANDVVNVQSSMFQVQSIEVIDVYGKVINTVKVVDNPTRINVSGLASGMYFVRVTTDEGVATKTFIKK